MVYLPSLGAFLRADLDDVLIFLMTNQWVRSEDPPPEAPSPPTPPSHLYFLELIYYLLVARLPLKKQRSQRLIYFAALFFFFFPLREDSDAARAGSVVLPAVREAPRVFFFPPRASLLRCRSCCLRRR